MKEPVLLPSTHDSLLNAFRTYLSSLGLSSISRKLYSADIARLLSSSTFASITIDALSNPKNYLAYLAQPELTSSATMLRRTIASLKQFGLFLNHSFSIPNPTQNLTLSANHNNLGLSSTSDKYIKACIQYLKENHLSDSSLRSYKSDITQYLTYLESHHPSTHISSLLNEKNLQIYADMLTHLATQSPATIERKLKTIRRFINWYIRSTPHPVISDNNKIAAHTSTTNLLSASVSPTPTYPASEDRTKDSPQNTNPDVNTYFVKKSNYRKFKLPTAKSILSFAILLLFVSTLSIFTYRQFGSSANLTAAFPNTPITPNRQLSFQGRLENASGTPITSATNFVFKLFDASSGGTELYSSSTCSITPDTDGVFSTQIGGTCGSGIGSNVFTENADVWLEVTVGAETLTPRQQIATVAYALNSETIQGFPISATVSAIRNTVVPMNQWGEIIVGEQSPRLTGVAGTFQISAPSLSLITATGTNGNITLAPDGTGQVNLNGNTTTTNFFNVSNAQLTTGSLITGTTANNNTGFKLIDLLSGTSPTSKFSVTDAGNVTLAGDLTITGDDLFMNTNTSGFILVADGTNYNPVAMNGDITINSSGVTTIGADKITEGMLKSVNSPSDELCLSYETSGGGDFEWQTCGSSGGDSYWRLASGSLSPVNDTLDLLIGSTATASAKAGFININSGTPTASVSAGAAGGTYLTATGTLGTTARQSLILGNSTTGNVIIAPGGTTALTAIGNNLTAANNLTLTASTNLIFGSTNLGETTSAVDSGAFLIGAFDEFANSNSTNVQAVLNDLDASITTALSGSGLWTDSGTVTYLTSTTDDLAVGGTGVTNSVFGIDESTGNFYLASDNSVNPTLLFEATDADAGEFGFNTNDSFYFSNASVGIGTTNPATTLEVANGAITLTNDWNLRFGNTADVRMQGSDAGGANYLTLVTGGLDRLRINNAGDVGIGTTGQDARLDVLTTSGEQLRLSYTDGSAYTGFTTNSGGDLTIAPSGSDLSITANATVSGNTTMGGQLQLGRFAATPTAIGAGTMIFDSTNNVFKCYDGNTWYNCGGTLFSNTNSSVADGSYITVTHNLATNDLLSSAWINAQGVWKSLDAAYKPAIAWEGKDTQKGIYHNSVNSYLPVGNETGTSTNTLHEGMVFDTFEDTTKTDSANTTSSISTTIGDDGSSNFATLDQRIQNGRVGLMGGQTLSTGETDNDGQTYLGSNTVNDVYYYDRSKDSSPEVLVELGIDPNWYNGVTLSVATSSAQYSQAGTLADKNPNLTTTYNGSLIKVTGTDSTPRTIYITIKSPTTFDWTNYQGDAASGVTITPGTAQTLGTTGVSITFTGGVSYNVGDVFKVASWYIEGESSTRGAKQQFPERSNIIATASSVDIIDSDAQKLWMRFTLGSNYVFGSTASQSVSALNGKVYGGGFGVRMANFTVDRGIAHTTLYANLDQLSLRNSDNGYTTINTTLIPITTTVNDVATAVIPNQKTQEVTVSGWGYIVGDSTAVIEETVNLPYKFNNIPNIITSYGGAGASGVAPSTIESCTTAPGSGADLTSANWNDPTTSSFQINLDKNSGTFSSSFYFCYTWTATGTVTPKEFVVAATGATSADGGSTIINETDGTKIDLAVGSQSGDVIWQTKAAVAGNTAYIGVNDSTLGVSTIYKYPGVHGLSTESSYAQNLKGTYRVGATGSMIPVVRGSNAVGQFTSLAATAGTSTASTGSNTLYVGTSDATNGGVTVIQENDSYGNLTDGQLGELGSVKYYTKDYISEEMIGDIRGMWPLNASNTTSDLEDVSYKANVLTAGNISSADATSGIRNEATDFDGSTEYLSCTDASCGGTNDLDYPGSGGWSFGSWFRADGGAGTQRSIINKSVFVSAGNNGGYSMYLHSDNTVRTTIMNNASTSLSSNTTPTIGEWYHAVVVFDGSTIKMYVNGQLENSIAHSVGIQDTTQDFYIGRASSSSTLFFDGAIDETFVTATALTPAQIKNMYQVGYRALQSHGTGLSSSTADGNQALAGASNNIGVVAPDYNNQFMYVGSNHTTDGALTKIQLNSDTAIKNWDTGDNDPDGGVQIVDDDITSLAVGETLYAVGSAASGVKTMGLDDNATATSGNFVSKTYVLPKNIGSAVLWVSPIMDESDGSNTLTVQASNDGGSNYVTCTLVNTNTNYDAPEREYACTFTTADNDLKVRFQFARGSTKTNTYIVQYGISWLGETGFRVEQLDNNTTRLYNFSGESQNLKLNVTGASTTNLASPWTDAGSYLYPTGYEEIRIYNGAGSNYMNLSDAYINFGSTSGSSGYGIRDNAGTMEFKNSAGSWTALGAGGASWWDQVNGTIQPYNKTVDFLLGGTATSSAKFAVLNMNSGTPTASISGNMIIGQGDYLGSEYGPLNLAYKSGTNAWTTGLVLQDSTGNVGIGVSNPTQKLEVNGYVVGQRFEDSASSAYYLDPAATGTSLSIDGNIVGNGAFYLSTGNDAVAVSIGTTGAGKLDAGTIDPPYTINGEKFATYMSGMTGVKEETTGSIIATEHITGKGYRATLDFASAIKGSDLWLFAQTTQLQNQLDKLVVLTTASGMSKTWYEIDASSGKLYLYSSAPTQISYRLTAPRFDASTWTNTRDSESLGFVVNNPTTWSVTSEIANFYNQLSDTVSQTLTNLLSVQTISPLAEGQKIEITAPVTISPTSPNPDLPTLIVDGEIQATTISARLAQLESIQAENITAKNIVADTITANSIIGLDAKIASLSAGMSDADLSSITARIKNRLAEITDPTTATDIPIPEDVVTNQLTETIANISTATTSATITTADIDFATINNYLAVIGTATITDLSVTNNMYSSTINSQSGTLALQNLGGIINLGNNTLVVDSTGSVVINGDLYVNGRILAESASINSLELGSAPDSTTSALGNLLAVYNENGETVATIDASGSANLASLTTNMITIASAGSATDSSALATLTGNTESNSTAGNATLTTPNTELTITSPYVTTNSLVYLTPTTNTDNKVLFVKAKDSCQNAAPTCTPSFTVGIDASASTDISFNWWIIELK